MPTRLEARHDDDAIFRKSRTLTVAQICTRAGTKLNGVRQGHSHRDSAHTIGALPEDPHCAKMNAAGTESNIRCAKPILLLLNPSAVF